MKRLFGETIKFGFQFSMYIRHSKHGKNEEKQLISAVLIQR